MRAIKHVLVAVAAAACVLSFVLPGHAEPGAMPAPETIIVSIPTTQAPAALPRAVARPARTRKSVRRHTVRAAARRRGRYGLSWPVSNIVTQRFGRRHGRFHHGVDIRCAIGEPIYAASRGKVVFVGRLPVYGGTIIVRHKGTRTLYGHLSRRNVRKWQTVGRNSVIGFCGDTGISTGPHLHFEVYRRGRPINPLRVLPRRLGRFFG